MNEEEFITKFYSCDNEEQFLKDICHNLNCLQKIQNNWNELKKGLKSLFEFDEGVVSKDYLECAEDTLEKMEELEQGKDE